MTERSPCDAGTAFRLPCRRICRGPHGPRLRPAEAVLHGSQFTETRPAPSAAVHGSIGTRSSEDSITSITAALAIRPAERPTDPKEQTTRRKTAKTKWRTDENERHSGQRKRRQATTPLADIHIIWSGSLYRMLQARGLRDVACGGSNSEPPRGEATARAAPRSRKKCRKECCGECSGECSKPEAAGCSCIFAHKKPDHET